MSKGQQDDLKDVGGYVGGTLKDNRRRTGNVISRSLITLDADSIPPRGETNGILTRVTALGCAYAVYSTRKHESIAPRLRIVIPTDRDMTAEEYEPIARKLADLIGMGFFDPASFRVAQFMYWASRCSDGEWVFLYEDRPFLRVDGILGMYADWHDTAAGAVLYDGGRFLYSNHATDPAGGMLCNSYDLVRVHLFGHLDSDAKPDTPTPKLPSAQAMREYALQDEVVRQEHVNSMFGAKK